MKKKINVPLLRKIQSAVLAEPKLYEQNMYIQAVNKRGSDVFTSAGDDPKEICGYKCCIAGWAVKLSVASSLLDRYDSGQYSTFNKAKGLLGLNENQARNLFDQVEHDYDGTSYDSKWPKKHAMAYLNAKTPAGKARAGYNMIEQFIKENA